MKIEDVITDLGGDLGAMGRRLAALSSASRCEVYLYTCHGPEPGHSMVRVLDGRAHQITHFMRLRETLGVKAIEDLAPRSHEQPQGEVDLRHVNDWTTLAWWDRSVDRRYGSMTALIVPAPHLSLETMVRILRQRFPEVWGRQPVPLYLSGCHGTQGLDFIEACGASACRGATP